MSRHLMRVVVRPPRQALVARPQRVLLGLLLLLLPVLAQAQAVYRWVDAQGRVHFGDPASAPSGAKAVQITGSTGVTDVPPPPSPPALAIESPEEGADPDACLRARAQLSTYQTAERIVETNSIGEEREYTEEAREQLIVRAEIAAQRACAAEEAE